MTFFTLIKGFIGTGILYLPMSFYDGGYLFSPIAMIISLILTQVCIIKLIRATDNCKAKSFSDLGLKAYGQTGKTAVGIFLILSQAGFTVNTLFLKFILRWPMSTTFAVRCRGL